MKYDFSRWSKNAVETFDLPSEYMYGAGDIWENHIHPDDREAYHKGIDEIFSGNAGDHDMQYRARRPSGEYDVCTCRGTVIRDPSGEPDYFAGTIRNHGIQGHIDTLTGFRNQYGFFEDLDNAIRRNAPISVLLLGISKFSEVNEIYGYHFGNRVIQQYARALFEKIGNTGHTYRIDGTKFAVISNTLSVSELRDGFKGQHIIPADHSQHFLLLMDGHGDLTEFHNDPSEGSHRRLEKLHAIRESILHDFEGFHLLFQPVVDAQTEQLIGAEALLRWKNDRYGMVPPDDFIPVLEVDPLFSELGAWILRESLFSAKNILKNHPGFVINVNLSYTQLEKPDFVDTVLHILKDTDYPPEHLCLEITERCRLLDEDLLKNVIVRLKAMGILIAMDDFGTGFSSVGLIRKNPFDTIKIDRSFVMNIENSETDRKLVGNIVGFASICNAKVCVEGIETVGMRDILRKYLKGFIDGHIYSGPGIPVPLFQH